MGGHLWEGEGAGRLATSGKPGKLGAVPARADRCATGQRVAARPGETVPAYFTLGNDLMTVTANESRPIRMKM